MFESGLEANATSFAPLCAENKRSQKVKVISASQHIACVKIGEDGMWGELKEALKGPIIPYAPPGPRETGSQHIQTEFIFCHPLLSLHPVLKSEFCLIVKV